MIGLIKMTGRITFRAEAHGVLCATEWYDNLRAVISPLRNLFERSKNWEYEVASQLPNHWLTDCQSMHDYMVNPVRAGCEDKRLEIDLDGLREDLWEYGDDFGTMKESLEDEQYNKPRWIDTSTMICDPLTKHGHEQFAARLVSTMDTGILNLVASASSELKKMRAQKARLDRIRGADRPED